MTLCGELASKPIGALALVALGYRSLSLTPSAVGPVKAMLLDLDAAQGDRADRALLASPAGSVPIRERLKAFAARARRTADLAIAPRHGEAPMLPEQKLDALLARHRRSKASLSRQLAPETYVKLSREFAELGPIVETVKDYRGVVAEIDGPGCAARGSRDRCRDARRWRQPRSRSSSASARRWSSRSSSRCCPRMRWTSATSSSKSAPAPAATRPSLFAGDLFRMYERYAAKQGWKVEMISASEGSMGGYKEIIAEIRGRGAFAKLKFESGVHRVQRVPDTEGSGRIHTSTATVAVLPEAEEVDIAINDARPQDRHLARRRRRRPARQQDRIGRSA